MRTLLLVSFWCRGLGLCFLFDLDFFRILSGKLKLLDQQPAAFRGLPVLFAPRRGQQQLQQFDLKTTDGHFAGRQRKQFVLREDHRVRGGNGGGGSVSDGSSR